MCPSAPHHPTANTDSIVSLINHVEGADDGLIYAATVVWCAIAYGNDKNMSAQEHWIF